MGGAGRFFKISLKQRKPRAEMSSLVDLSDKKISCFAIACWRLPWIRIPKDMSGFYDPRFYDSRFPFYDMQQQQQMPLPFVFNGSTSPPVPQNSQQREGASSTQQSLPSTPSPQSSLSSVEEENAEKRKPKSYDKCRPTKQKAWFRWFMFTLKVH